MQILCSCFGMSFCKFEERTYRKTHKSSKIGPEILIGRLCHLQGGICVGKFFNCCTDESLTFRLYKNNRHSLCFLRTYLFPRVSLELSLQVMLAPRHGLSHHSSCWPKSCSNSGACRFGEKLVARGVSGLSCPSPLRKGKKDGNNRILYVSFLTASLPAPLQDITIVPHLPGEGC